MQTDITIAVCPFSHREIYQSQHSPSGKARPLTAEVRVVDNDRRISSPHMGITKIALSGPITCQNARRLDYRGLSSLLRDEFHLSNLNTLAIREILADWTETNHINSQFLQRMKSVEQLVGQHSKLIIVQDAVSR